MDMHGKQEIFYCLKKTGLASDPEIPATLSTNSNTEQGIKTTGEFNGLGQYNKLPG
jgi:hypothetical protein